MTLLQKEQWVLRSLLKHLVILLRPLLNNHKSEMSWGFFYFRKQSERNTHINAPDPSMIFKFLFYQQP